MDATMKAVEATGRIDEQGNLQLDCALNVDGPRRVRVIVLMDELEVVGNAARSVGFAGGSCYLEDPEDICPPEDEPFCDPG